MWLCALAGFRFDEVLTRSNTHTHTHTYSTLFILTRHDLDEVLTRFPEMATSLATNAIASCLRYACETSPTKEPCTIEKRPTDTCMPHVARRQRHRLLPQRPFRLPRAGGDPGQGV